MALGGESPYNMANINRRPHGHTILHDYTHMSGERCTVNVVERAGTQKYTNSEGKYLNMKDQYHYFNLSGVRI